MGLIVDSDEHRALRESVAKIAEKYGHRYFAGQARKGDKLTELWTELAEMGILALPLPEDRGGVGLGWAEAGLAFQELGRSGLAGPFVATAVASESSSRPRSGDLDGRRTANRSASCCRPAIPHRRCSDRRDRWRRGRCRGRDRRRP